MAIKFHFKSWLTWRT